MVRRAVYLELFLLGSLKNPWTLWEKLVGKPCEDSPLTTKHRVMDLLRLAYKPPGRFSHLLQTITL